jgi:two-component system response regulator RegX3
VLSRAHLIQDAWGGQTFVTDRAVDGHIVCLRRKIEEDPTRPRHLVSIRGLGYRLDV